MSNANRHIDQKATRLNPKPLILNKYSSGTIYDRCDIIYERGQQLAFAIECFIPLS
jgi:hypothetical protein